MPGLESRVHLLRDDRGTVRNQNSIGRPWGKARGRTTPWGSRNSTPALGPQSGTVSPVSVTPGSSVASTPALAPSSVASSMPPSPFLSAQSVCTSVSTAPSGRLVGDEGQVTNTIWSLYHTKCALSLAACTVTAVAPDYLLYQTPLSSWHDMPVDVSNNLDLTPLLDGLGGAWELADLGSHATQSLASRSRSTSASALDLAVFHRDRDELTRVMPSGGLAPRERESSAMHPFGYVRKPSQLRQLRNSSPVTCLLLILLICCHSRSHSVKCLLCSDPQNGSEGITQGRQSITTQIGMLLSAHGTQAWARVTHKNGLTVRRPRSQLVSGVAHTVVQGGEKAGLRATTVGTCRLLSA